MHEDHTDDVLHALQNGTTTPSLAETVYAGFPAPGGGPYQLVAIRPGDVRVSLAGLVGGPAAESLAHQWDKDPLAAAELAGALIYDAHGGDNSLARLYRDAVARHVVRWLDPDGWTLTASAVRAAILCLRSLKYAGRDRGAKPVSGESDKT